MTATDTTDTPALVWAVGTVRRHSARCNLIVAIRGRIACEIADGGLGFYVAQITIGDELVETRRFGSVTTAIRWCEQHPAHRAAVRAPRAARV